MGEKRLFIGHDDQLCRAVERPERTNAMFKETSRKIEGNAPEVLIEIIFLLPGDTRFCRPQKNGIGGHLELK